MVVKKIITIKHDTDESLNKEVEVKIKYYDLSKTVTIDPQAKTLPQMYIDIDANRELCGLDEIKNQEISEISEALFEAQKEMTALYTQFERDVFEIEAKAKQRLADIGTKYINDPKCQYPRFIFEPLSFRFTDQNEAKIALRLFFDKEKSTENRILGIPQQYEPEHDEHLYIEEPEPEPEENDYNRIVSL